MWQTISICSQPSRPLRQIPAPKTRKLFPRSKVMINRKSMELEQLVRELRDPIVTGPLDRRITSLGYDSRDAGPDSLFVAIRGHVVDGHSFIEQAIERGAIAIVSEEPGLTPSLTHIQGPDSRDA